jgi:spore coat polysaccharide biosynthesis protein SpsF
MNTTTLFFRTQQEAFWAGECGNAYLGRNENEPDSLAGQLFFFAHVLEKVRPSTASISELGANFDFILRALKYLFPHVHEGYGEINLHRDTREGSDGLKWFLFERKS